MLLPTPICGAERKMKLAEDEVMTLRRRIINTISWIHTPGGNINRNHNDETSHCPRSQNPVLEQKPRLALEARADILRDQSSTHGGLSAIGRGVAGAGFGKKSPMQSSQFSLDSSYRSDTYDIFMCMIRPRSGA